MGERYDIQRAKEEEMRVCIKNALQRIPFDCIEDTDKVYEYLKKTGSVAVSVPYEENFLHLITLDSGFKGNSVKAGNIKLNVRLLIKNLHNLLPSAVSVVKDGIFFKICAFLSLWQLIRKVTTVEISREQGIVLLALWEACDENHKISVEKGFDNVSKLCRQNGEEELTEQKYLNVLNDLEKLGSVEMNDDGIWLREWIRAQYD